MRRLIGVVVGLWVLQVPVAMAAPGVLDAPLSLQAGSAATLRVEVPAAATVCSFTAKSGKHRVAPSRYKINNRLVSFSWRVPRNASAASWTLRATCSSTEAKLRSTRGYSTPLKVQILKGVRNRRAVLVARGTLRVRSSKLVEGVVGAGPQGETDETIGLGAAGGNPFPFGQCTYHAYERRADIYDTAVARGVPRGGTASGAVYGGIPDYWWNGWHWADNARRAGFPVGTTPVVGALAVYPRNWGGSAVGHVAYVIATYGDGSYRTSDRNVTGSGISESRRSPYPGVEFVYGGPAGGGPGGSEPGNPGTGPGSDPGPEPIGPVDLGQGMTAGTSPAIAALAGGGYQMAFQANTGELIRFGAAGNVNERQGMAPGTSPAIAGLAGGGYEMAFQANTGQLIRFGTAGNVNEHQGMAPGTSPAIAGLAGGGYEMAFQANTGRAHQVRHRRKRQRGPGDEGGDEPSIAALPGGGYRWRSRPTRAT